MKIGFLLPTVLACVFPTGPALAGLPQTIPNVSLGVVSDTSPPFALPETSTGGLSITWQVMAGSATVSGNIVTLTGATGAITLRGRQAGNATYDAAPDRYITCLLGAGGGFQKVSAGETFVVGIKSNGALWAWGSNTEGQLGDGTTTGHTAPAPVTAPAGATWTEVACGRAHTVARHADGSLWAWGANSDGQLGLGTVVNRSYPTRIGTLNTWAGVACGSNHTLAWRTDGSLWTWGDNREGQLGDGTIADRKSPVRVGTAFDWVEAAAGAGHSVARRAGGSIWTWGLNSSGQLGDGSTSNKLAPVRVGNETDWTSITTGFMFSAGRRADGTLWAWGNNASGQLGQGTRVNANVPLQIGTRTDWATIRCGAAYAMATKSTATGQLHTWGDNSAGQLGDGTTYDRLTPRATLAGPWNGLSAGAGCALGISGGQIWSWGTNDFAQLALPAGGNTITAVPPGPRLPLRTPQTVNALPPAAPAASTVPVAVTSGLLPVINILYGPATVTSDGLGIQASRDGYVKLEVSHPGDASWGPAELQTYVINFSNTNDTPVAISASKTAVVNVPATIRLQSTDADVTWPIDPQSPYNPDPAPHDSDPTYAIATAPQHGTLSGTAPQLVYTPNANFAGTDTFTFTVNDGLATSAAGTIAITIQPDSDADQLPDAWEQAQFGSLIESGTSDTDKDGQNNLLEFNAGNSPTNAAELITLQSTAPGDFRIAQVRTGVRYILEYSTDLGTWQSAASQSYTHVGPGTIIDPAVQAGAPRRFYRMTAVAE